jgi:polyferredoxin/Pyruvate/2-oxoacid:ferredoxin oxidoreductase delta subunit
MLSKKNLRIVSQGIFLLIFLFLFIQTESKGDDTLGYPVKLFLDFDPLIFITTFLASRAKEIPSAFFLSLITVLLTIVIGRVFCGWICPLGTLNNIVSSLKKRHSVKSWHTLYKIKYYILIMLLISSVFTLQIAGIVDPLSLLIRSFSLSIYPLMNYGLHGFFDAFYNANIPLLVNISESAYSFLKKTFLSFRQPHYLQGVFIGFLFFSILILNIVEKRFWCKYLCPLGALLGLLSRFSLLKREVSEGCTSCGVCNALCQGGALSKNKEEWRNTECFACFTCDDVCPNNAVRFGFGKTLVPSMDLGRRQVILSMLSGFIAVPLIRSTPFPGKHFSNPELLRPPGALEEKEFLKRCVKCGECMRVCITNGLQPTLLEAGFEGLWSPRLIPRMGYCEYRCTLCGQVCPSGAIRRLNLEEKAKTRIGLAMIDTGRCLPHAHGIPCIVCEEVCPTQKKAIWFEERTVKNRDRLEVSVKQPHVDLNLCIGCGICEAKCPVGTKPAIYVTNIGESRSPSNQLLL